jgi:AcrR family transcriptional regulator
MARPANTDSEKTRTRILEAACDLYALHGAAAVGLRQVGARAGVGLATINHHFRNKEGLEDAVMAHVLDRLSGLRTRLIPMMEEMPAPALALERIIRLGLAFVREHQRDVRMLMRTVTNTGHSDARTLERSVLPMLDSASMVVASLTGLSVPQARMFVLSLNHLVIRYGLTATEELIRVTGVERPHAADAGRRASTMVEQHLLHWSLKHLDLPTVPAASKTRKR